MTGNLELKESMKNSTMNHLLKYNSVQAWCWVFVTSGFTDGYVLINMIVHCYIMLACFSRLFFIKT